MLKLQILVFISNKHLYIYKNKNKHYDNCKTNRRLKKPKELS